MLALNRLLPSQIEVTGGSIFFNNKNLNNMEKKEFYRERKKNINDFSRTDDCFKPSLHNW